MKTRTCEIRKSFFHYTAASPLKQHEMHPYPFGYLESPLLNIRVPLNHPFCRRRGGCRKVFCRWAVVRTGGAWGQCTHVLAAAHAHWRSNLHWQWTRKVASVGQAGNDQ